MPLLLLLHACVALGVVLAVPRAGRVALHAAAVAPLATLLLTAASAGSALDGTPWRSTAVWVERLDLGLSFELHALSWLLTVLVGVVGLAVLAYTGAYAGADPAGARLAALLVLFAGAMLGLVWAADAWTLFLFWEATTVLSFLLVGLRSDDPAAVRAARHALVITGAGGLALLGGLVLLGGEAGSTDLAVVAGVDPGRSTVAAAGAVLVLVAAATKSALWPFSGWLPGAMAAPTPVSAFLHSATMVKAGVYVLVLVGPAFADLALWRPLLLVTGGAALLWGGWRALAQDDLKLLLAHSTVSQLGLIAVLAGFGTPKATFAAVAVLFAHGLFKAALFLVVGAAEHATGTRDRRDLRGVGAAHPVLAGVAVVAGASMAGLPPTFGFVAKEAGLEGLVGAGGALAVVAVAVVATGSVLTVGYTIRLVEPFLARRTERAVVPVPPAMVAGPVALAAASLVGGLAAGPVSAWIGPAAAVADPGAAAANLKLLPGWTVALGLSAAIVVAGTLLGGWWARRPAHRPRGRPYPDLVDALLDGVVAMARRVTARLQHGDLAGYLVVIVAVATLPTLVVLASGVGLPDDVRWAASTPEAVAAGVVVLAVIVAVRTTRRLAAVLAVGAAGYAAATLFVAAGAPDLALTQLLVETLVLIGFVLVVRRLRPRVVDDGRGLRMARPLLAGAVGALVVLAVAGGLAARSSPTPAGAAIDAAPAGGGNNVVNIVLTNFRALDTLGEITVVAAAGAGVAALVGSRSRPRQAEGR